MAATRSSRYQVWSRSDNGRAEKHGEALGLTFEDACKQLASESIDFWTHFARGCYQGRPVYPTESLALSGGLEEPSPPAPEVPPTTTEH